MGMRGERIRTVEADCAHHGHQDDAAPHPGDAARSCFSTALPPLARAGAAARGSPTATSVVSKPSRTTWAIRPQAAPARVHKSNKAQKNTSRSQASSPSSATPPPGYSTGTPDASNVVATEPVANSECVNESPTTEPACDPPTTDPASDLSMMVYYMLLYCPAPPPRRRLLRLLLPALLKCVTPLRRCGRGGGTGRGEMGGIGWVEGSWWKGGAGG